LQAGLALDVVETETETETEIETEIKTDLLGQPFGVYGGFLGAAPRLSRSSRSSRIRFARSLPILAIRYLY
jgi:hypothetical protein